MRQCHEPCYAAMPRETYSRYVECDAGLIGRMICDKGSKALDDIANDRYEHGSALNTLLITALRFSVRRSGELQVRTSVRHNQDAGHP